MASEDRVRVVVRVRPKQSDEPLWVQVTDDTTLQTVNERNRDEALQYDFSRVFGPEASQKMIYQDTVLPLFKNVLQGKNSSVFAYGPTGAGKTFTILGSDNLPGIIPRCVRDLFTVIEKEKEEVGKDWTISVTFSYSEIYNEKVQDLLEVNERPLQIVEDHRKQIVVMGLTEKVIENVHQFNELFGPASNNRTTAATRLNERSSRSHSLLLLKVSKVQRVSPFKRLTGKLYLIDLAGSEDNRRTGNQGMRLKESGAINTSLLVLGQVVEALNKGNQYVPYRGSKLTRLLQDSLGGNATTTMIVNLSPEESHYFDTKMTLNFARKSKKIVNYVKVNESYDKPVDHFGERKTVAEAQSTNDETPIKQPKLSDENPRPFLSPLIRNQKHLQAELRDEMLGRLDVLERKLLRQIRKSVSMPPDNRHRQVDADSTSETADSWDVFAPDTPLKEIQQFKQKLSTLQTLPKVPTVKVEKTLEDETTLPESPLFANPRPFKRKFRSVASKNFMKAPDTPDNKVFKKKYETDEENFNPEAQRRRNEYVLNILNTGSIKTLVSDLVTVGPKRAQVIHAYRELYGSFQSFEDLFKVPSLKQKYIDTFLKNNLVRL